MKEAAFRRAHRISISMKWLLKSLRKWSLCFFPLFVCLLNISTLNNLHLQPYEGLLPLKVVHLVLDSAFNVGFLYHHCTARLLIFKVCVEIIRNEMSEVGQIPVRISGQNSSDFNGL